MLRVCRKAICCVTNVDNAILAISALHLPAEAYRILSLYQERLCGEFCAQVYSMACEGPHADLALLPEVA